MQKRMYRYFSLATIVGFGVLIWLLYVILSNVAVISAYNRLDQFVNTLKIDPQDNAVQWLETMEMAMMDLSYPLKVSIYGTDGNLLATSVPLKTKTEEHTPKEIAGAIQYGYGRDRRNENGDAIFVAKKINNKVILLATNIQYVHDLFWESLPLIVVIFLCCMSMVFFVFQRISVTVIAPIESFCAKIKIKFLYDSREEIENYYEELMPLYYYFNDLLKETQRSVNNIKNQNEDVANILSSMQEGLIMVDNRFDILVANENAKQYLNIPQKSEKINILHLLRQQEIRDAFVQAKEKKVNQVVDIVKDKEIFRMFVNPAKDKGYILIISNVTTLVGLETMRREFTSNVTHELKTPLTSIRGFTELMHMKIIEKPEDIVYYSGKILSEVARLMALVDDILELSDIESGREEEKIDIDIKEMFVYASEILKAQMIEKTITLHMDGDFRILADQNRMYELVFNLLGNAVKYNFNDGHIWVTIFETETEKGFVIKNTGHTIPQESLNRIFERFYRVEQSRGRKDGGTGLGLAIVKHIVELYQGEIEVSSDEEMVTFRVVFPKV